MANTQFPGVFTALGGSLYQIAAEQLGSAMQWINIAQANGITDPNLTGPTTLIIPAASSAFSDGISPQ
jgi:hypothetical protein